MSDAGLQIAASNAIKDAMNTKASEKPGGSTGFSVLVTQGTDDSPAKANLMELSLP
jgi:hypothetical protein